MWLSTNTASKTQTGNSFQWLRLLSLLHPLLSCLQVNGIDVRTASHETAVSLLIERRETITLLVCHVPPPPGLQEITLVKGLHDKLGLSIRGGMKTDYADEGGIYISKVTGRVGGAGWACPVAMWT